LRLRPTSFSQLYYHTQTPFEFRARDGRLRYCKFRLVPENRGKETGIPHEDDLRTPWFQEAHPGETLTRTTSRTNSRSAYAAGRREIPPRDTVCTSGRPGDVREDILSSLYAWDETTHPWMDVATVKH